MARICYARVSTRNQDLDTQLTRLKAEGCGIIRAEKASGGSREGRAELATVIEFLCPGNELVVARLDPHVSTRSEMGRGCSLTPKHDVAIRALIKSQLRPRGARRAA